MNTSTVLIVGNTFPVREALRAMGGTWDAGAKGWRVPADKADEAQALAGTRLPARRRGPTLGEVLMGTAPMPSFRLRTGNRL